jgi:hypothetical protein
MRRILSIITVAVGLAAAESPALAQKSEEPFHWSGDIQNAHWVYVRNLMTVATRTATIRIAAVGAATTTTRRSSLPSPCRPA